MAGTKKKVSKKAVAKQTVTKKKAVTAEKKPTSPKKASPMETVGATPSETVPIAMAGPSVELHKDVIDPPVIKVHVPLVESEPVVATFDAAANKLLSVDDDHNFWEFFAPNDWTDYSPFPGIDRNKPVELRRCYKDEVHGWCEVEDDDGAKITLSPVAQKRANALGWGILERLQALSRVAVPSCWPKAMPPTKPRKALPKVARIGITAPIAWEGSSCFELDWNLNVDAVEGVGFHDSDADVSATYDFATGEVVEVNMAPRVIKAGVAAPYLFGDKRLRPISEGQPCWSANGNSVNRIVDDDRLLKDGRWADKYEATMTPQLFDSIVREITVRLGDLLKAKLVKHE